MSRLTLHLGVKTDPIQYRFSYEWLFRLLAEEGVEYVQLGTFFEIYQLPNEYFHRLRATAEDFGVQIRSVFTAHRELGGFFVDEPGWEEIARRNYRRLIEVGSIVGAKSVGSNPGAVYRDRMGAKGRGVACYLGHMEELMVYAHELGVKWLTIEPMSCLAEPPTLPEEIQDMGRQLTEWHDSHPDSTARIGYCTDIAHGYADADSNVRHDHLELLESTLPYLVELHLKNCDPQYSSTFGFGPAEREQGIVEIEPVRQTVLAAADVIPVEELVGYLEIGGPKLGRDYSDKELAEQLRASLRYLKEVWPAGATEVTSTERQPTTERVPKNVSSPDAERPVLVTPSIMCADLCHLEEAVRRLEMVGADMLHLDVADGHFVPNLLLGLDVIGQLRRKTRLPLDAHLMVDSPDQYLERLAEFGVDWVCVHPEGALHFDRTLTRIRELGMKAGAALNPATPPVGLEYVLPRLDYVLLMTVNPGFAGQKLVASAIRKIADCRRFLDERDVKVPILVDGNVSFENIPRMVAAGADVLVAGTSSWFHPGASLKENVATTARAIQAGLEATE